METFKVGKKMKHAYLIIAHNEPEILKVLISMLDDSRNDIYLHIDKKSDLININELTVNKAQLFILEKRINNYWMDISQIRTELLLFETAYKKGCVGQGVLQDMGSETLSVLNVNSPWMAYYDYNCMQKFEHPQSND